MTKEEILEASEAYYRRQEELTREMYRSKQEYKKMWREFVDEAFENSGYEIGQPYEVEPGKTLFVSGAHADAYGNVFISFNKPRKDGTRY